MNQTRNNEQRHRGTLLMDAADALTNFRYHTGPCFDVMIGATDENPVVTAAEAIEVFTEAADGSLARRGAKLLGVPTRPEGAVKDPQADKRFANAIMRGLVVRFIRQKDYTSAAVAASNFVVSQWRDARMAADRQRVQNSRIDPEALKAIKINKTKTALQLTASLAATHYRDRRVRRGALLLMSLGTAVGVAGEYIYRRKINELIDNATADTAETTANP